MKNIIVLYPKTIKNIPNYIKCINNKKQPMKLLNL